jgi:pyridoxal phosphate enzyme (YggS family)
MIAENIKNIEENVKKICFRLGKPVESVKILAVSKTFDAAAIIDAWNAGILDFGENYVQELVEKRDALNKRDIRWHFIGHLQRNKVKYIAEWIYQIHSIDTVDLAREIQKHAAKAGRSVNVLIEVNTSREATKYGVHPDGAVDLAASVAVMPNLNLKGFMTIGPFTENKHESRASFKLLRSILFRANELGVTREPMMELSMGMTHDYEIAIEEGATSIRIGTAIFGNRSKI